MEINIRILGSTSAGNCTLIWDGRDVIMIDCGFGPGYILENLKNLKLSIASLSGVLITHTHHDHVKGAMLKKLVSERVPIFCHYNIAKNLIRRYKVMRQADSLGLLRAFSVDEFKSGAFVIQGFKLPHDSPGGCFGFNVFKRVKSGVKKITIAMDLGYSPVDLVKRMANSDVIIIESNHDIKMLETSRRPSWLKQRIRETHLSNDECAGFLTEAISRSRRLPQAVILAHISQQCNTNFLARNRTQQALSRNGYSRIRILLTYRMQPNETVTI